jgi:UDPglucose 6-dehydrogenase
MELAAPLMPDVTMCTSAYAALEGADAAAIVTEWDVFRALDLSRVKQIMNAPVLVELRNVYRPADMQAAGFAYTSIGRG